MAEFQGPPDPGGPDPGASIAPETVTWDTLTQGIREEAEARATQMEQDVELAKNLLPPEATGPDVHPVYNRGDLRMFAAEAKRELLEDIALLLEKHRIWDAADRKAFIESFGDMRRLMFWTDYMSGGESGSPTDNEHRYEVVKDASGGFELSNVRLFSSKLPNSKHAPVLDLDFPCRLVPSSTDGHYHLYLDKEMSWEDYKALLQILMVVGILEEGYVAAAIKRGQTFVRAPWEKKIPDKHVGEMK